MTALERGQSEEPTRNGNGRFGIGVLLYFGDSEGRVLLMERRRQPNRGLWCAVGGKLETAGGESPYDCAIREAKEEVDASLLSSDLALRCILSEKDYEASGHWLMFVFEVLKPLDRLPDCIDEGCFKFFEVGELAEVAMPDLDRFILLERILATDTETLFVLRADKGADRDPGKLIEESSIGVDE